MSELLDSLNMPSNEPAKTWASEVAAAVESASAAPEPISNETPSVEPSSAEPAGEEPRGQETAQEETDRRVPLKALQEERQKRAEYERQVQEFQRREQEWAAWAAQVQQQMQPQEQAVEPDPETDPIGALKHAREQQRRLQEAIQQQQEAARQQQYVQQLNQVAYQAATQFQQQAPDYQDAYRYALQSRAQELVALGTPETQVAQILQREELSLIDTALRNGRNPAEAIYQFAKARGFSGKTAASPAPAAPDPALQQAKAAVAPSATSGGAPAARGSMSLADIANLKGAAFDSAWSKHFGGNRSSLFRD